MSSLRSLNLLGAKVDDLSPLEELPLTNLTLHSTKVTDLSPLRGMPLVYLNLRNANIPDLSLLKEMPLKELACDFDADRHTDLLRSIKTLEKINDKPVAEFWKEVEAMSTGTRAATNINDPAFQQWMKEVAALPAEEQVEAVVEKLRELNPDFDGRVRHTVEKGVVVQLHISTGNLTDISPVRALAGLEDLEFSGNEVADLSPLQRMGLKRLHVHANPITDLSPLRGMQLTNLGVNRTQVTDLSPLEGMALTTLDCNSTKVTDLSPLKGMPLTILHIHLTKVSDLSPLKDMPLVFLKMHGTQVSDLSPLKAMPLTMISCDFKPERDVDILRSIKSLKRINDKPAKEFWDEVEASQAKDQ